MSVYNVSGDSLQSIYSVNGTNLSLAYDAEGTEVYNSGRTPDYDQYDNEYQHSILTARNAWADEYRADNDIVPLVLTTDQHGYMNAAHGKALYDYLSLAVNWSEASAAVNLGDVCGSHYTSTTLDAMQTALSSISPSKQINVAGNHDVQGITDDDEAMDTMFDTYFNNSAYSGASRYGHRGCETMVDSAHKIRYIVLGSWDYQEGDKYYYYHRSTDTIAWLIDTMETVDNNDIILLTHVPTSEGGNIMFEQYYPAVDSNAFRVKKTKRRETSLYEVGIQDLIYARKNKQSGTFTDVDGYTHSYDFTHCTSDFVCSLHGHSHIDWYDYISGAPSITFDAYRYDDSPFFFIAVDRDGEKVDVWKIGESSQIQTYTVPFTEHVNPCTAISIPSTLTIAVGESATITPTFTTQYEDDGTYPHWMATWRSFSTAVASVADGVVTGLSEGTCRVDAYCGSLSATCTVTVTAN